MSHLFGKMPINKVFIDSNLWIYAFISTTETAKWKICIDLLERLLYQDQVIVVSTQIINEVHL